MNTTIDYQSAGVNISAGNEAVNRIKRSVESTFSPNVLTHIGSFGAMFDLKPYMHYQHPVLVQSIDGVGTKMMVAKMMNHYETIGIDLVSATTNDIIVLGATPLTLLDYIANDQLDPEIIETIMNGMTKACREHDISLVGGETAEMPGTYLPGEHDLVGVITGILEKDKAILGDKIKQNDVLLAFPSSGLHTNGYSLARKLCFDIAKLKVDCYLPECQQSLGEVLLTPHINYTKPVLAMLEKNIEIKGMAHITGGGLLENIPRILPPQLGVEINIKALPTLPIFDMLTQIGSLPMHESYRTFNMGVGLVLIVDEKEVDAIYKVLNQFPHFPCYQIGLVIKGQGVKLI